MFPHHYHSLQRQVSLMIKNSFYGYIHKYVDYSLVLFNYTTVVRVYDLPRHGVWTSFTLPGIP